LFGESTAAVVYKNDPTIKKINIHNAFISYTEHQNRIMSSTIALARVIQTLSNSSSQNYISLCSCAPHVTI